MAVKKILCLSFLVIVTASFLHSQSLTDMAKKEKERREALKGKTKTVGVVTNADLARLKKKPALGEIPEVPAAEAVITENPENAEPAAEAGDGTDPVQIQEGQAAADKPEPESAPIPEKPLMSEKDFKAKLAEYQAKITEFQDMGDLLTLKMNALQAQFYNLTDMTSRELIQKNISETYDKLTKAQEDLKKAQADLDDFSANARREGVPQIWIR